MIDYFDEIVKHGFNRCILCTKGNIIIALVKTSNGIMYEEIDHSVTNGYSRFTCNEDTIRENVKRLVDEKCLPVTALIRSIIISSIQNSWLDNVY